MHSTLVDIRHAMDEAQRKGIEVLVGTPYSADELDAVADELGIRFPPDFREIALEFGGLSFRKGRVHFFAYGKPSAQTLASGIKGMDLLADGRKFQSQGLPFPVAPVASKLDPENGHWETTLVDGDGKYRTLFDQISEPRSLVDVAGIFPYFVMMFRDDGSRRTANELLDLIGVIRR